jgi:hypothetical protein
VRNTTLGEGVRNYISGFEGSQAAPSCPSGIGNLYGRNCSFFIYFYIKLEWVHYSKNLVNVGRAILGRNFDVTSGRAACETCGATWNLGTNSALNLSNSSISRIQECTAFYNCHTVRKEANCHLIFCWL